MLLGAEPVASLPLGDAPEILTVACIPSPVPNSSTRLMIIDLGGRIDSNIQQVLGLQALAQPGIPESVSFSAVSNPAICLSPSNSLSQAVACYLESFTLPITLEIEVYTVDGTFYTFRTCL
jgi:hypothetical protein